MKKIGYLGPAGTFCEQAALKYVGKQKNTNLIPFDTIHDAIIAADRGAVDEAVVPIENSIEGAVGIVTDMLAKDTHLKIKAEIVIPVYHYLLAAKTVKIKDVTDVISHPQTLEQCKEFIRKKLKKAKLHLAYSNADAASQVAGVLSAHHLIKASNKESTFAAIGPLIAAEIYGLSVLANKINASGNSTRFIVLSKKQAPATGRDKTSIVFSILRDMPGGLHHILGEFATRAINLTKIESRPSKKHLGDYFFFVDMEGHLDEPLIKEAINDIRHKTSFLKILGSYPMAKMKKEQNNGR